MFAAMTQLPSPLAGEGGKKPPRRERSDPYTNPKRQRGNPRDSRTVAGINDVAPSKKHSHLKSKPNSMAAPQGTHLLVQLSATETRRRLKGFGHGVRKIQSAGRKQALIIHTATGRHLAELQSKFADVGYVSKADDDSPEASRPEDHNPADE
jgi:hypothetical protein